MKNITHVAYTVVRDILVALFRVYACCVAVITVAVFMSLLLPLTLCIRVVKYVLGRKHDRGVIEAFVLGVIVFYEGVVSTYINIFGLDSYTELLTHLPDEETDGDDSTRTGL